MKHLLLCTALLVSSLSAEFAIIENKAGFAYLHADPDLKSAVVTKVLEGEFLHHPDIAVNEGWHDVSVFRKGKWVPGYLHESSLKLLNELPKHQAKGFKFNYISKPFDKKGRKLKWHKDGRLIKIDGAAFYGGDWGIPKIEITGVNIVYEGKKLVVAKELYRNLFQPNDHVDVHEYRGGILIYSINCDGGGAYELLWVVDQAGKVSLVM